MNKSFSTFCKLQELCESHSVYIPENFNWVNDYISIMPKIDLKLPIIQKQSKIYMINKNKNPISIHFEDGSKIFCSYDEFLRLPKNIDVGQTVKFNMFNTKNDKPMIVKSFQIIS